MAPIWRSPHIRLAHYHFTKLQSSEWEINKGLDLWLAAQLKAGDNTSLPWSSTEDMYQTIDSIQEGDAPFKTIYFKYLGAIPANPPAWMTQTYELCTHDSRILMHNQLDTTDFVNTFTPSPYRQFDHNSDCVKTFYFLLFPQCLYLTLTHSSHDSFDDSLARPSHSYYPMIPSIPDSLLYYDSPQTSI